MEIKKLLLATDGSERADKAAEYAIGLARGLGATLQVIAVVDEGSPRSALDIDPDTLEDMKGPGPADPSTAAVMEQVTEARMRPESAIVERVAQMAKAAGVQGTAEVIIGNPADEILAKALEGGADVIVMGSHGRSAVGAAIMGSTATNVIHKGEIPVLVIPSH